MSPLSIYHNTFPAPQRRFSAAMSLDNSTLPDFREIELNTLALDIALHLAFGATDTVVQISLASLLFG